MQWSTFISPTNLSLFRTSETRSKKGNCHFVKGMDTKRIKKTVLLNWEINHTLNQIFSNGVLLKDLMVLNYLLHILITYCIYPVSFNWSTFVTDMGSCFYPRFCCFIIIGSSSFERINKIFHFINIFLSKQINTLLKGVNTSYYDIS